MPNGRCRIHGGLTPVGFANSNTITGRHSKDLPTRLAARYQESMSDPDLIGLRDELALIDARLADVLGRVDTGEAGTLWAKMQQACGAYRSADEGWEKEKTFSEVESLCREGQEDWHAWSEVLALIERRRKVSETETKRLSAMGQAITAEKAMLLLGAVVAIIREHVSDRTVLASISRDIGRIVSSGTEPTTRPGLPG